MNFLERAEQWLIDQDPESSLDLTEYGDGTTMQDVQDILESGGSLVEVYDYISGIEPVVRFTFSDGVDYFMEGTLNDVNNELWEDEE